MGTRSILICVSMLAIRLDADIVIAGVVVPPCETCVADRALSCNDGNQCTHDWCHFTCNGSTCTGCCRHDRLTGTACQYPVPGCWQNVHCQNGTCVAQWACDDGIACTLDTCVDSMCHNDPIDNWCNDGDPCTNDWCADDGCHHYPNTGADCPGTTCHYGLCENGECTQYPASGGQCGVGYNPCFDYICVNGVCTPFPRPGWPCEDDDNPCTRDVCDEIGMCTHPPAAGGICEDDLDPCTREVCDNEGNCTHPPCPGYAPGMLCCGSLACTLPPPPDCDDRNACTIDTRNAQGQCVHTPDIPDPADDCTPQGCNIRLNLSNVPPIIPLNDNDSNGNGIPDYQETGFVAGDERYIVPLTTTGVCQLPSPCGDPSTYKLYIGDSSLSITTDGTTPAFRLLPPWPTQVYLQAAGITTACGSRVHLDVLCPPCSSRLPCTLDFSCCNHWCGSTNTPAITVVHIKSLEWGRHVLGQNGNGCTIFADNPPTDRCPNNGGVRMFPDLNDPNDTLSETRRTIDLVATIEPPVEHVLVWFRAYDVDDPFDDVHGPLGANDIAGVNILDSNGTAGGDNRGSGGMGTTTAYTDKNGVAWVPMTVSLQPGDNYRAAATLHGPTDLTSAATTAKASALSVKTNANDKLIPNGDFTGFITPVFWSPMLTVWRRLHVETDAMARPTFLENVIVGHWGVPSFPNSRLSVRVTQQDVHDNFENGFILFSASNFPDLTTRIITYVNGPPNTVDIVYTALTQTQWGGRPAGGEAAWSDDDLMDLNNFQGQVVGSDIGVGNPPNGYLPLPDTSQLETHYRPAYVLPVVEGAYTSTTGIAFVKNIDDLVVRDAWDSPRMKRGLPVGTPNYWTSYVYSSFQPERWEDVDGSGETTGTKGISTHSQSLLGDTATTSSLGAAYTGMCAIFVEVLRDGYSTVDQQITVSHEIAHTLGVDHGTGLMGQTTQTNSFSAQSLLELRRYTGP